jgi:sugar-phosphatase
LSFAAVLSDLDGVLVDSTGSVERSWRAWARRCGVPEAMLAGRMHGRPSALMIAEVAPDLDAAEEAAWVEAAQARDTEGIIALPGACELLSRAAPGRLAVVTSCTPALAASRLGAGGLPTPPHLVTVDRVARGKPAPDGYLLAAKELGVDPAACVVVEDAPAGVAAGKAAGMTVLALTTTHAASALGEADELAPTLRELLPRLLR